MIVKRTWMGLAVVAMGLAAGGCHEPTDVVPVYPLGMEPSRIPNIPAGEGAQAVGEQPAVAPGQNRVISAGGAEGGQATSPPTPVGQPRTTPSGLTYVTTKEGTGEEAKTGQQIRMHYTGTLEDGTKFDSSRDRNQPFPVRIGTGAVIAGWDEGVPGMKVGEQRKLTIPAKLGYGDRAQGDKIPANSTLIFDVELLGIDK